MVNALAFQIRAGAQGWKGLNIDTNINIAPAEEGYISMRYSFSHMGLVKAQDVEKIRDLLGDSEAKITEWEQYEDMQRLFRQLQGLKKSIREELAVVTLRRILPGKQRKAC